eukprot:scaffold35166_cov73-Cyclotella_meneghiniana.AAC.7
MKKHSSTQASLLSNHEAPIKFGRERREPQDCRNQQSNQTLSRQHANHHAAKTRDTDQASQ